MEDYILLSIPLYILLGEILVRSGATDKMYGAIALWLGRLPGGLLHTNVGASALFSAVSGSSVSTAATIATVALPSFRRRKYDDRLVLGSIAAGASLGNLIPPGIAFIVYASLTNTSVGQLYAAAIIPSIMMTVLFMLTIIGAALVRPDLAGEREPRVPLRERIARLADLTGPFVVFVIIMGSVYTGWATVTEFAALSVIAALGIAAVEPHALDPHAARCIRGDRQPHRHHDADPRGRVLSQLRARQPQHHADAGRRSSPASGIRPPA